MSTENVNVHNIVTGKRNRVMSTAAVLSLITTSGMKDVVMTNNE